MTEKLRLDIAILLPGIPNADDACVARLISEIQGREGIDEVHVTAGPGKAAQLCIHYDAAIISLLRIRELVDSAGAKIADRFGHILWQVEGITHERRARTVAERLRAVPGVLEAEASATGLVRAEFDRNHVSESSIRDALVGMGIRSTDDADASRPSAKDHHDHGGAGHRHADKEGADHGHAHKRDDGHAHG
ncbi:hypothetical protein MXD81_53420, partial [Microbacteriaceae bacterium K1510]|nr:hypothetical protein [Microbacteriaceae bacterium K1510]